MVTPKAPIHVTLMPEVQPTEDGPIFHCGWKEPKKLPHNSCWVLRLPFIYCGKSVFERKNGKKVLQASAQTETSKNNMLCFFNLGESGAHLPPQKEVTPRNAGRILKGVINVCEEFEDFNKAK